MLTMEKHQQGLRCYQQGRFDEAVRLFGEALEEEQTGEIWNDWAAAQLARGSLVEAEDGFRRALKCDPEDAQAAANLGVVLAKRGEPLAAIEMLEEALRKSHIDSSLRTIIEQALSECRANRLRTEVNKIQWWHSIDLGHGVVTSGSYDTRTLLNRIRCLPISGECPCSISARGTATCPSKPNAAAPAACWRPTATSGETTS